MILGLLRLNTAFRRQSPRLVRVSMAIGEFPLGHEESPQREQRVY